MNAGSQTRSARPNVQTIDLTSEAAERVLTGYRGILPIDKDTAHLCTSNGDGGHLQPTRNT
jgi:hypothetical protein